MVKKVDPLTFDMYAVINETTLDPVDIYKDFCLEDGTTPDPSKDYDYWAEQLAHEYELFRCKQVPCGLWTEDEICPSCGTETE